MVNICLKKKIKPSSLKLEGCGLIEEDTSAIRLVKIEGGAAKSSDCLKYHRLEQHSSACRSIQKGLSHSENTSGTKSGPQ